MKEKWETEIGNLGLTPLINLTKYRESRYSLIILEPFLESVPQIYILLVIWSIDGQFGGCSIVAPNAKRDDLSSALFKTTFIMSILTASLGISKFLKCGPCHFIRNDSYLMGYGTISYILLLINIWSTLVSKGFVLFFYVDPVLLPYTTRQLWRAVMILNFIPQLLHVTLFSDSLHYLFLS